MRPILTSKLICFEIQREIIVFKEFISILYNQWYYDIGSTLECVSQAAAVAASKEQIWDLALYGRENSINPWSYGASSSNALFSDNTMFNF